MKKIIKRILNNSLFYIINSFKLKIFYKKSNNVIWFFGSANYNNIGDLAISEATKLFLKDSFPSYSIYEIRLSDYDSYKSVLKKFVKDNQIIILQGGGNLGVNYFSAEENRREILQTFNSNPIFLFPCTIDYGDSIIGNKEFKKSIKIYNSCKNLTLIAREEKTYEIFKKNYNCRSILAADIVLYLKYSNNVKRTDKIGICLRNDLENNVENINFNFINNNYSCEYFDNICKQKNISIKLRKKIINEKLNQISKFQLVITDRLHTMIFCYITNTKCIAINNLNGKIKGVYEKWLSNSSYIHLYEHNESIDILVDKMFNLKTEEYNKKYNFNEILKLIKEEM